MENIVIEIINNINLLVILNTSTKENLLTIKNFKFKDSEFILASGNKLDVYQIKNGVIYNSKIYNKLDMSNL